ncbi:MAG: type II toxin-antitoxin system RelE/ParE family toxin [Candidatus Woesearchaeota archaeon]
MEEQLGYKKYQIHLSDKVSRFLQKLDVHVKERLKLRLKNLEDNPVPSDAKFIVREGKDRIFRYRLGDYRALYKVKYSEGIVLIAKLDKRPRIYHR